MRKSRNRTTTGTKPPTTLNWNQTATKREPTLNQTETEFRPQTQLYGGRKNWVKSRQVQKLWIENWIAKCRRKKKYLERSGSSSETQKQASVLFWKLMPNPIYKWCCCCCCEQIYFFLLFLAGFQSFAESQSIGENDKVFWTKPRLGQGQLSPEIWCKLGIQYLF